MSELQGIYTLWHREVLRYTRERSRMISSFIQPLLWLIIFGAGISLPIKSAANISYQMFIFPGVITQALQFTSMFMGISVIWDRQFGFMKEILVAPVSRVSIFLGQDVRRKHRRDRAGHRYFPIRPAYRRAAEHSRHSWSRSRS